MSKLFDDELNDAMQKEQQQAQQQTLKH